MRRGSLKKGFHFTYLNFKTSKFTLKIDDIINIARATKTSVINISGPKLDSSILLSKIKIEA